jgi:hypothetical protein
MEEASILACSSVSPQMTATARIAEGRSKYSEDSKLSR